MFATQISHTYAHLNVRAEQTGRAQNHGKVVASYTQRVSK
jgi:hypothetical protein